MGGLTLAWLVLLPTPTSEALQIGERSLHQEMEMVDLAVDLGERILRHAVMAARRRLGAADKRKCANKSWFSVKSIEKSSAQNPLALSVLISGQNQVLANSLWLALNSETVFLLFRERCE